MFRKRQFSILIVVSFVNIGLNVFFIDGEALYDFSCFRYAIAHTVGQNFYYILILGLDLNGGTYCLKNSYFIISNCKFSGRSTFPENNGLICLFGDRPMLFANVSFFCSINLHIRVGRFRGAWGIGDKHGRTAKWTIHHNILWYK